MRVMRVFALSMLLSLLISGCLGSGDDPCFDADKTQDEPDDDARVHLMNFAGQSGLTAVFVSPDGTETTCEGVSADVGAPTNVVMNITTGDQFAIRLLGSDQTPVAIVECEVTEMAFGEAVGSPGNVFVDFDSNGLRCTEGAIPASG